MVRKVETGTDNPVLRQKAKEVKEITPEIKRLVLDMIETLESDDSGIGLAAPQIGQSLRIIIAKPEPDEDALVLINPEIKRTSFKKDLAEEGCLSLPGYSVVVKRPVKITVQGLNPDGEKVKIKAKGLLARVIQHEVEHLDSILISDKTNDKR